MNGQKIEHSLLMGALTKCNLHANYQKQVKKTQVELESLHDKVDDNPLSFFKFHIFFCIDQIGYSNVVEITAPAAFQSSKVPLPFADRRGMQYCFWLTSFLG